MKYQVQMDDGLPAECPKCSSTDLCICNDNGMECIDCGCWFDTTDEGELMWAYESHPEKL